MDLRFSLAGFLVGVLTGLTGMGGSALLAPILILFFRVPPVWAVGTDIAYSSVTKAVGSIVHIRQKFVNFKIALWLACGSIPATFVSAFLVQYMRKYSGAFINDTLVHVIGVALFLAAFLLLGKPSLEWFLRKRAGKNRSQEKIPRREVGRT